MFVKILFFIFIFSSAAEQTERELSMSSSQNVSNSAGLSDSAGQLPVTPSLPRSASVPDLNNVNNAISDVFHVY